MRSRSAPHPLQREPRTFWACLAVLMPGVDPWAQLRPTQAGDFFNPNPNSPPLTHQASPQKSGTELTATTLPRLTIPYLTPGDVAKRSPQGSAMTPKNLPAGEVHPS
jgi:hypothetical protein